MNHEIGEGNNFDVAVYNGYKKDLKVKRYLPSKRKENRIIDITESDNTSRDILDIADTPDVAVWNKLFQNKSNVTNQEKHPKGRDNGLGKMTGIGLRKEQHRDKYKNSEIIDPANQKDIDDIVNSGSTLTDNV
ncbi:MAG: hypothetical protein M3297_01145 [Thermoproteota archaeon]|jgi:hypothetical protein|nr:hypothetical protein [Thermoproteota archaeon]